MIGLILFYFIGKQFYRLAEKYEKSNWGFAILGIATYYAGTFIVSLSYYLLAEILESEKMYDIPMPVFRLLVVPFGLLACWILYQNLEHSWQTAKAKPKSDTIDDELIRKI